MTTGQPARTTTRPTIAVIGAGLSGLFMSKVCQDRGINHVVYEKASEVGGTWRDNTYPGIGVDSPGGWYNLPFEEKYDWSRQFAPGGEIQDYLVGVADKYGLRRNIRFNTEVSECRWQGGRWSIEFADGSSAVADVLVVATGFIRVPTMPDVKGIEDFAGPWFHTSKWDHSVKLEGKRIGVVGTGSSGIQITTALGRRGLDVTQFIRTPQWVWSVKNPENPQVVRRLFDRVPAVGRWVQKKRLERFTSNVRAAKYGTDWRLHRGIGREEAIQAFQADLASIRDPELAAKMRPRDLPGCKRIPLAPGYYDTIQRRNVTIVRGSIDHVEERGLVTDDGTMHELDVIAWATGYDTHGYFKPIKIYGTGPEELSELWDGNPRSYRGMMMPGFPNLFVVHGPYAPVNNIHTPLATEDMIGFIMKAVDYMVQHKVAVMPTVEAMETYLSWVRAPAPHTTWGSKQCENWYTAADGHTVLFPYERPEHIAMYWSFDAGDCELIPVGAGGRVAEHA
ncbi:putative monooxygenase [Pseudonocardia sulfidoxydans NBRC 16205]|uniref:Putative monooxygenase n=2 Tax=Pseudonocardia sulfidoxydans TaxID=54011 RepID=A0A511DHH6_9PSEU|nr:NAD(P)/FAD-dependent oxidoreductase [Pseudonocardia sulfidoxydans]GEL24240.1 putative monooxygenase [Pseudonocardia sulfidoxydans NBRC 16205]